MSPLALGQRHVIVGTLGLYSSQKYPYLFCSLWIKSTLWFDWTTENIPGIVIIHQGVPPPIKVTMNCA